jgi:hypothetical protein
MQGVRLSTLEQLQPGENSHQACCNSNSTIRKPSFQKRLNSRDIGPLQLLSGEQVRRCGRGVIRRDDLLRKLFDKAALLSHWLTQILNNGRATESQTGGDGRSRRMNRIRVDLACEWLGRFAKLCMNSTQALFVQKDTGPIVAMIQTPCGTEWNNQRAIVGSTVSLRPALFLNPPLFFFCDANLMFTTAASTVMATPVLQHRKNDALVSHGISTSIAKTLELVERQACCGVRNSSYFASNNRQHSESDWDRQSTSLSG